MYVYAPQTTVKVIAIEVQTSSSCRSCFHLM